MMIPREVLNGVVRFAAMRRKETGGYGATPLLPATIEDTFYALSIFEMARFQEGHAQVFVPPWLDTPLRNYLDSQLRDPPVSGKLIYRLLTGCRIAGVPFEREYLAGLLQGLAGDDLFLERAYYLYRTALELAGDGIMAAGIRKKVLAGITALRWKTAREARMWAFLGQGTQLLSDARERITAWLQTCQNCDGGFGFMPGTTSFIENSHTCLSGLAILGQASDDPGGAGAFIISCRTGSGGFSRMQGAAPFLDATWHGLKALWVL